MKKILQVLLIGMPIYFLSCKKSEDQKPHCSQCKQVVSDSTTGNVIEIKTGDPSPSAMYYCGDVLDQVRGQQAVYFHNTVYYGAHDTSHCQKYVYSCPN